MPLAGSIDTVTLELEVFGPDTEAALTVIRPDGSSGTAETAAVSGSNNKTWRARVAYPIPGVYTFDWLVSGAGEGRPEKRYRVSVGPAAAGVDPRHTYATSYDLATYLADAPPLDSDRLLRDASAAVDDMLLCAVYPIDEDEMPTDPAVAAAMRDATCAVAKWRIASGYDETAGAEITSASIAGVSLGFKAGSDGAARDGYGNEARQILREAGLIGASGPWH